MIKTKTNNKLSGLPCTSPRRAYRGLPTRHNSSAADSYS
jgi:hypothetical protein